MSSAEAPTATAVRRRMKPVTSATLADPALIGEQAPDPGSREHSVRADRGRDRGVPGGEPATRDATVDAITNHGALRGDPNGRPREEEPHVQRGQRPPAGRAA